MVKSYRISLVVLTRNIVASHSSYSWFAHLHSLAYSLTPLHPLPLYPHCFFTPIAAFTLLLFYVLLGPLLAHPCLLNSLMGEVNLESPLHGS